MEYAQIISKIKSLENKTNVAGMARFGITPQTKVYGVNIPVLRKLSKEIGKNHSLAEQLWESEIHEARLLAAFIEDTALVSEKQMDEWVKDFDSWDICDQVCMSVFDKTPFAYSKVKEWAKRDEEFVRRAAFALVAALASHDKDAADNMFENFFPLIKKYSTDSRNYVRKAVNWALRQIGKRNKRLLPKAIKLAEAIEKIDSKTSRWIAKDALRELRAK